MAKLRTRLPRYTPHVLVLAPLLAWVGHEVVQAQRLRAQLAAMTQRASSKTEAPEPQTELITEIVEVRRTESCPAPEAVDTSSCTPPEQAAASHDLLAPGGFAFVRGDRLVLDVAADLSETYGETRGDAVGLEGAAWAERDTYLSNHAGFEELDDQVFQLFDANGVVCEVELGDAFVRGEIAGELGLDWPQAEAEAYFDYAARMYDGETRTSTDKVIEALGRERILAGAPARLEAEFEVRSGDCAGALWGRAQSFATPTLWTEGADGEKMETLLEDTRAHADYQQARRDFAEIRESSPEWFGMTTWTGHEAETLQLQVWRSSKGEELSTVELGEAGNCGDPDTHVQLRSLDGKLVRGPGTFDAVFSAGEQVFGLRYGVGDIDASLVQFADRVVPGDEGPDDAAVLQMAVPFYGCPC